MSPPVSDRRTPAVAQAAQSDLFAVGQDAGDVGEAAAVGDLDPVELGPVLLGVGE